MFTAKWPAVIQSKSTFFFLAILILVLAGCASRQEPTARVPQTAGADPSFSALTQGLQYIRENPAQDEATQLQRFLWLDNYIRKLQDRELLTAEMGKEFWDDLTSFVRNPEMSATGLEKLTSSSQSRLGRNVAYYHMYQSALRHRSLEEAMQYLSFIEEDGISDLAARAQELLDLAKVRGAGEAKKIGIMLPLTGDLRPFAEEVLQGIQVAARLAYSEGIEFVVVDSGTTPEQLHSAWERLVAVERVMIVIGPLTAKDSEMVFEKAEVVQTPVISLASKEGMNRLGGYGFQSSMTLDDQVRVLAEFLSDQMKVRRVAILMPDSTYGWDVVDRAKTVFQDAGLEIRQIQVYQANTTDFKEPLKRLVRLDQPKARKDELCPKSGEQPEYCVKSLKDLPPIVDFEALFVPDFADTVGLLLPTLPYLRIYGVQVVGLSGFNSPRLIERGGESANGVIFTDGYLSTAKDLPTEFFKDEFKKLTGKEPTRLAAEGFDVALMVTDIMNKSGGSLTREMFVERLKSVYRFPGVTGSMSQEQNRFRKTPRLIVVRGSEFKELN